MNKRGILFTIVTIFLLTSVFLLSSSYVKRNKLHQDIVSEAAIAEKARFIHEDIVTDFMNLLDITLDQIVRNSTSVNLRFTNFSTIGESTTYSTDLSTYEAFIQGTFSNLTNTIITLESFTPMLSFYPYNSTIEIHPAYLQLYTRDYTRLNYIYIELRLNQTNLTVSSQPTDDAAGNPLLKLNITDADGTIIGSFSPKTYILDAEGDDQRIIITEDADPPSYNISILFGKYTEINPFGDDIISDGVLFILVSNLQAKVGQLELDYDLTAKNTVLEANATIYIE